MFKQKKQLEDDLQQSRDMVRLSSLLDSYEHMKLFLLSPFPSGAMLMSPSYWLF